MRKHKTSRATLPTSPMGWFGRSRALTINDSLCSCLIRLEVWYPGWSEGFQQLTTCLWIWIGRWRTSGGFAWNRTVQNDLRLHLWARSICRQWDRGHLNVVQTLRHGHSQQRESVKLKEAIQVRLAQLSRGGVGSSLAKTPEPAKWLLWLQQRLVVFGEANMEDDFYAGFSLDSHQLTADREKWAASVGQNIADSTATVILHLLLKLCRWFALS